MFLSTRLFKRMASSLTRQERILIALGGNAIQRPGDVATFVLMRKNINRAMHEIADLIEDGHQVTITHGNGPQVGNILLQNELARNSTPEMPLAACVAESQGLLGHLMQQCLTNHLRGRGINKTVVSLVTQTEVDPKDPAWGRPTKPVGGFYDKAHAERMMSEDDVVMREDREGWRIIVPSPAPVNIVEMQAIADLVEEGHIVIASGGGGVPVITDKHGHIKDADAVVDKDAVGCLLAKGIQAERLLLVTQVDGAYKDYQQVSEELIERVDTETAEGLLKSGHFEEGSMLPKVEAAVSFAKSGGFASICALGSMRAAIAETRGTHFEPALPSGAEVSKMVA